MRLPTGPEVWETEIGSHLNDSGRRLVQPDGGRLTGERVGGSFQAGTASEAVLMAARPLVPVRREAELDPAGFQLRRVRYYRDAGLRLDYLVPVAAGLGNPPLGQVTELTVQPGSDGHKPVTRVGAPPDREKALVDHRDGVEIAETGDSVEVITAGTIRSSSSSDRSCTAAALASLNAVTALANSSRSDLLRGLCSAPVRRRAGEFRVSSPPA